MKKRLLILVLCLANSIAYGNFAEILVLKGKASKLLPGKMRAEQIKKGESLPEYTSIVTYDKSFLRVRFKDNSVINLGANSKMVIASKKNKDGTVINFLKGVMRSQVDKDSNKAGENKMIIKTRTAVMGIRGTKFIVSYNPTNKNTALVTVEGKVAIAKIDEKEVEDKKISTMPDEKKLEAKLAKKEEVVEVNPGEFSGTTEETKEAFKAVKIAPKQFIALAKSVKSEVNEDEIYKEEDEGEAEKADLKSGGLVDLKTGFYVPPTEDAEFDTKKGVYIAANDIGEVDKNGNYSAPEGVKLDALRGFVAKDKETKVASNDLNKNLKKKYEKVKAFNKEEDDKPSWIKKYLPKNHLVKFFAAYHMEENDIRFEEMTTPGPNYTYRRTQVKSEVASKAGFSLIQEWGKKFSTSLNVSFNYYKLDSDPKEEYNSKDTTHLNSVNARLGFHYAFNPKMKLSLYVGEVDNYRAEFRQGAGPFVGSPYFVNSDLIDFNDNEQDTLELEWIHYIYQGEKWKLGYLLSFAQLSESNEDEDISIDNSNRYKIGFRASKELSKSLTLTPYIQGQIDAQKMTRSWYGAGSSSEKVMWYKRRGVDLGAELKWDY